MSPRSKRSVDSALPPSDTGHVSSVKSGREIGTAESRDATTILLVDDEPAILTLRRLIFEGFGYVAITAASGEEALEILRTRTVDAVIMDYEMHGMDGEATARGLRRLGIVGPIILSTGCLTVPERMLDLVTVLVTKGSGPGPLLTALERLLAGRERAGRQKRAPMATRILVVDDNAMFRKEVCRVLEAHAEWEVCGEAADGMEAIEKNRVLKPDFIVMDFSMPRMSGVGAATEILKEFPKVPILLLTLYATRQLAEEARHKGIKALLSKAAAHQLVGNVDAILRGEELAFLPSVL
jgi:CheY-like chemotaxis protein